MSISRRVDDSLDVLFDRFVISGLEFADIDDHIDLVRAVFHRILSLEGLDRAGVCAEGKSDDAAGHDAAVL